MYGAIQLYGGLYGVPAVWHYIQHASQVLYHTHVSDLPDTHSHTHTQLLACILMQLEVGLGFFEAAAARSIGALGGASMPWQDTSCHPSEQAQPSHQVLHAHPMRGAG